MKATIIAVNHCIAEAYGGDDGARTRVTLYNQDDDRRYYGVR
jgi:hypothetical protein